MQHYGVIAGGSTDTPIRHVIFDLDGTLVDSCAVCVDILSDMLIERGSLRMIDPIGARAYMSRGGLDMVAALLGEATSDPHADLADFRARYSVRKTPIDTLFPGVADCIRRLHAAGFTLSICSNKPQGLCDQVLADTGLAGYFAVVVGGQSDLRAKPAPDLLDAVLTRLGCGAEECLFVGDSELDHAVALAASMPFHFLTYGYAEPDWVPQYGTSFDCFSEMTSTILSSAGVQGPASIMRVDA